MKVKAFLEALNNDVTVVIKEADNTQIAQFNRNSYKVIAENYLKSDIDDIEIVSKGSIIVIITLKEEAEANGEEYTTSSLAAVNEAIEEAEATIVKEG